MVVDPVKAAERWSRLGGRVLRVRDVWLDHSVRVGGQRISESEYKGSYDDVFTWRSGANKPVEAILFDVSDSAPTALPPLHHFGRAMAEILLEDARFTPALEQALTFADFDLRANPDTPIPGAEFRKFLRYKQAAGLLKSMQRAFRPLSPAQRRALYEKLLSALAICGMTLAQPDDGFPALLGPSALVPLDTAPPPHPDGPNQEALREALAAAARELSLPSWAPTVDFLRAHRETWRLWRRANRRGDRMIAWARTWARQEGLSDPKVITDHLQTLMDDAALQGRGNRWRFSPETLALRLLEQVTDSELSQEATDDFLAWLPEIRCAPVKELTTAEEKDWGPGSFAPSTPSSSTAAPPEKNERDALFDVGESGEQALLDLAIDKSLAVLERLMERGESKTGWEALEAVLRGAEGRRRLQAAREAWETAPESSRTRRALRQVLQVSTYFWAAGFDILLLEEGEGGEPLAVRWEVKTVRQSGPRDIYLSSNELAVAQAAFRDEARWHLVAVVRGEDESIAIDLTERIRQLSESADARLLEQLREQGVRPNGLVLRFVANFST